MKDAHHKICYNSKNKRFGRIEIVGDFDEWRDDEDYFIEDEKGSYDDVETCGFWFYTRVGVYILSPSDVFYMLEKIFSDEMICYVTIPYWKSALYKIEEIKLLIKKGKIRKKKKYRFWSGNYPISSEEN